MPYSLKATIIYTTPLFLMHHLHHSFIDNKTIIHPFHIIFRFVFHLCKTIERCFFARFCSTDIISILPLRCVHRLRTEQRERNFVICFLFRGSATVVAIGADMIFQCLYIHSVLVICVFLLFIDIIMCFYNGISGNVTHQCHS